MEVPVFAENVAEKCVCVCMGGGWGDNWVRKLS